MEIERINPEIRYPDYLISDYIEPIGRTLKTYSSQLIHYYHIEIFTFIRKEYNDVWYLIKVVEQAEIRIGALEDIEAIKLELKTMLIKRFIVSCYKVILFYKIDTNIINPFNNKPIIFIDELQISEEERLILI